MSQLTCSYVIHKIISGGQTGVDRAALDIAHWRKVFHVAVGVHKGRKAEDGVISHAHYPLQETPSSHYSQRTKWNVRDSSATLLLTIGPPTQGTAYTLDRRHKNFVNPTYSLIVTAAIPLRAPPLTPGYSGSPSGNVLNVAGPRESRHPGNLSWSLYAILNSLF